MSKWARVSYLRIIRYAQVPIDLPEFRRISNFSEKVQSKFIVIKLDLQLRTQEMSYIRWSVQMICKQQYKWEFQTFSVEIRWTPCLWYLFGEWRFIYVQRQTSRYIMHIQWIKQSGLNFKIFCKILNEEEERKNLVEILVGVFVNAYYGEVSTWDSSERWAGLKNLIPGKDYSTALECMQNFQKSLSKKKIWNSRKGPQWGEMNLLQPFLLLGVGFGVCELSDSKSEEHKEDAN